MSVRTDIRDNLIDALKGVSGVRQVTDKFTEITNVSDSKMPYVMVVPALEERERVGASKWTECIWDIDVWCYVKPTVDIEPYVDSLRVAILADLSRGGYALDTFVSTILTSQVGVSNEYGLMILTVEVKYRVREPA